MRHGGKTARLPGAFVKSWSRVVVQSDLNNSYLHGIRSYKKTIGQLL
jgi:hypothetical protein